MIKNGITILLILFLTAQIAAYGAMYDFLDEEFDRNFSNYCKDCNKEIKLEAEITRFLSQKQTPISLDECLDIALENNFNIKSQKESYKSSTWLYKNALTKFLPDFAYSFYSIYYNGQVLVGTALVDKFKELALSSMIIVSHQLTEGGKQIFEAKIKKFEKYEQKEKLNYTKEEVLMKTADCYWRLLGAKINIEIYIKNLFERTVQLKLTENLEKQAWEQNLTS